MRPLSSLAVVFLLAVAMVVGCDSGKQPNGDSKTKSDDTSSTSDNTSKPTIGFVTNQIASFWDIAKIGCEDAGRDLDVNVEVRFPSEGTATKQKQIVEDLFSAGIDALAVSLPDAENQKDMLNAWCAKVPTITHDSDAPDTERLMYVGMDNYRAGRMVGKLIKDAYPDGCNLILTIGRMEQDNARKRRQGVIDELLDRESDDTNFDPVEGEIKNDKYVIFATLVGDESVAQQKAEDALNAYENLDLFVGLFAYNPPACLQAIKKANLLEKVKIAGFDEHDVTLQGIKDGTVIGTVVQNPYEYGYQSVRVLKQLLDGDESVIPDSKFIDIPARAITRDGREIGEMGTENVDDFWADLKAKTKD